jgi:pimeloyl-ACP methyl ester carboxylesterase
MELEIGYKIVNGLKMYYEIHGSGYPLVLIHGGGSTIQVTFEKMLPLLSKQRKVIAVELQGHGRTADRDRPYTFEQDADDVAGLLQQLKIGKTDIFGFSNGANTAMQVAIRHPQLVHKLVVLSGFYRRSGMNEWFWPIMEDASIDTMPEPLKVAYRAVAPNPDNLILMHDKDRDRMLHFKDWPDEMIRSITMPTLVMASEEDVMTPEHTVQMYRLLPQGKLVILPGIHGVCIGEAITGKDETELPKITAALIERFLG